MFIPDGNNACMAALEFSRQMSMDSCNHTFVDRANMCLHKWPFFHSMWETIHTSSSLHVLSFHIVNGIHTHNHVKAVHLNYSRLANSSLIPYLCFLYMFSLCVPRFSQNTVKLPGCRAVIETASATPARCNTEEESDEIVGVGLYDIGAA